MKQRFGIDRIIVFVAAGLLLAACAATARFDSPSDLEKTWLNAVVFLPRDLNPGLNSGLAGEGMLENMPEEVGSRSYAAVIYLHGCTGLGRDGRRLMRTLAGDGMIVVAPNSMARSFRPLQCDPKTKSGGKNLYVYEFRMAELHFALDYLWSNKMVDRKRVYVIGTSEGAVAAALYRGDEPSARVLLQWTCQGAPLVRGVAAPPKTRILAIVRADDPWYDGDHTDGQSGHCGSFLSEYTGSESIVRGGKEAGHDVLQDPENVAVIRHFLRDNPVKR